MSDSPADSPRRPSRAALAAALVLALGTLAGAVGFTLLRNHDQRRLETEFSRTAENHFLVFLQAVDRIDYFQKALQTIFHHSGKVEPAEFQGMVRELSPRAGILRVEWAPRVTAAEREAFLLEARWRMGAGFQLQERTAAGGSPPASGRAEHFPLYYTVPSTAGVERAGLDLAADAAMLKLIHAARDSGRGHIQVLADPTPGAGSGKRMAVVSPVYSAGTWPAEAGQRRTQFRGVILTEVGVRELVATYFEPFQTWGLDWLLRARTEEGELELHFHSSERRAAPVPNPGLETLRAGLHREHRTQAGNAQFTLHYRPSPEWIAANRGLHPFGFVSAVIVITLLLTAYVVSLARRAETVEELVARRTAELHNATDRARASELRFRAYMENTPMVAWLKDAEFRMRYCNAAHARLFNLKSAEDMNGKFDAEYMPAEVADKLRANDRLVLSTGQALQLVESMPGADGVMRHWLVTKFPFRGQDGKMWVGGCAIEITDRLRAEEALAASEQRFRSLVEHAPVGVWQTAPDGDTILYLSPALCRLLELGPDEPLAGLKMRPFIDPRYYPDLDRQLEARARGETSSYEIEYVTRSGRRVPVLVCGSPLRGPDGALLATIGMSVDISERRKATEALRQERNLLRTLIDRLPENIYIKDINGAFVLTNVATRKLLGLTSDTAFRGKTVGQLFPPDIARAYSEDDKAVFETGRPVIDREEPFRTHDGAVGWYLTSKLPLHDAEGRVIGLVGISRDVTAQREAEAEKARMQRKMEETQKLESLGVLAGGIAHDFNNILTGILGNASLARVELPASLPAHGHLQEIETAALRAADLCKQMLAYAGKGRFIVRNFDLSQLVENGRQLLQVSVSKGVLLRWHLAAGLPPVRADATQLRQILMNLVINASEAIGERSGFVIITTGLMRADRASLNTAILGADLPEGDYVYLEVADNGCGMDAATRARIFDPFFTTKFLGRGLGLAAVLGIVRSHGGALQVTSEPGKGSTFRLLLPCATGAVEPPAVAGAPAAPWQGSGEVLVVDDEETVRTTTARMLEMFGFTTTLAADGVAALEVFQQRPADFTFVLLDLTMPRLDGVETFDELRRARPDLRVLVMSGFNEQEVLARFNGRNLAGFIQKPFQAADLRGKIRSILEPSS